MELACESAPPCLRIFGIPFGTSASGTIATTGASALASRPVKTGKGSGNDNWGEQPLQNAFFLQRYMDASIFITATTCARLFN
jgi:hypothetical protein